MKKLLITLFTSLIFFFPLTAIASPDLEDVTMSMMDDDSSSNDATEIDVPGDDGINHDLDDDSSHSSSSDDSSNDSSDSEDSDDASDSDDGNEVDEVDEPDQVDEPDEVDEPEEIEEPEIEDPEDGQDPVPPAGGAGGGAA